MNGVKTLTVSLQNYISPFFEDIPGNILHAKLDKLAANIFGNEPASLQHHIVTVLVPNLLSTLDKLVLELGAEETRNPGKPLLSVQSLRVVYTSVELLWQWGMASTLQAIVPEYTPSVLSFPNALLVPKRTIDYVNTQLAASVVSVQSFHRLASSITAVICNDSFSGLMLQRNLDRVLYSYLVLSNSDKIHAFPNDNIAGASATGTEMGTLADISSHAAVSLRYLYEGPFASLVVSKLRSFTKGPAWLRDASCTILTRILQGQRGVETVLSGYLDGSLDSAYAAALQAHVAKLITTAPARFSNDEKNAYLTGVTEQVKDLLLYGLFKNDKTLMRVCVLMVQRLAVVCPAICAADLIVPLAAPLLSVPPTKVRNNAGGIDDSDDEIVDIPIRCEYVYEKYLHGNASDKGKEVVWIRDPVVSADALCVQSCTEMLHLLLTLCPLHRSLVRILCSLQVDTAMLHLYSTILPLKAAENSCPKVDAQLFDTVESFCVNLFRFVGAKMVFRVEHFLYAHTKDMFVNTFSITQQGLVEVRTLESMVARDKNKGEIVSSLAQIVSHAKGGNMSGDYENRVQPSEVTNSGTSLLEVTLSALQDRLKAVVALLLLFEDSIAAREAQIDVATPATATSTDSVPSSSASKLHTTSYTSTTGTYEYLASELFLRSLAGFLHLSVPNSTASGEVDSSINSHTDSSVPSGDNIRSGKADNADSAAVATTSDSDAPKVDAALYGAVVLALQEQLPFPALLRDGLQILRLLQAFVEHYANGLSSAPADAVNDTTMEPESHVSTSTSTSVSTVRRPLIEEIVPSGEMAEPAAAAPMASSTATAVTDSVGDDLIFPVLSLLATILHLGQARRSDAEEALIRSLLPPLQTIAFRAPLASTEQHNRVHADPNSPEEDDEEEGVAAAGNSGDVAQTASDVALMILSRSYQQSHPSSTFCSIVAPTTASSGAESFLQLVTRMRSNEFLFSDSPAMRGYATRIMLQNIQHRAQTLNAEDTTAALDALLPLLSDQESFVYLNALVALRQLSESSPKIVFKSLLGVFAGSEESQVKQVSVSSVPVPMLPQGRRAMVGEALVMLLQRAEALKQSRPVFRLQIVELLPTLVRVCLAIAQQRLSSSAVGAVDMAVDLQNMRVTATQQVESGGPDLHISNSKMIADVSSPAASLPSSSDVSSSANALLAKAPQVSALDLEHAIVTADASILRQSAVSLLAEALILAGAASYRYLDDIIDLAMGMLGAEQGHGQSARAARRAAAYLASRAVTLLCESLGVEGLLLGQKGRTYDSFQHNYEALQRAALHDTDDVVKFHASRGLFALQDLYGKMFAVPENTGIDARVVDIFRIVK